MNGETTIFSNSASSPSNNPHIDNMNLMEKPIIFDVKDKLQI